MKLKNSQLLLILLVVIVLLIGLRFLKSQKEVGSLKQTFFEIDSSQIVQFNITPLANENEGFKLVKNNDHWMLEQKDKLSFRVSDEAIIRAIEELFKLKPSRLASESKDSWSKYEVDTAGSLLEIFTSNESFQIIIGKMIFQNQVRVNQYVRLPDEDQVYACESYLEGTFKNPVNKWRNKQNIVWPLGFWQEVNISGNAKNIGFFRNEDSWINKHTQTDLGNDVELIALIDGFNALGFSQNVDLTTDSMLYSIQITTTQNESVKLSLYKNAHEMILSSAYNTGNYFVIDSSKTVSFMQEIKKYAEHSLITPLF